MNKFSGIYKILNKINNKLYIGSALKINERWYDHREDLRNNKHYSIYLQRAWNKYGEENFVFEVIECVFCSYERDNGYNMCKIAGSALGYKHSEEARKNKSDAMKGEKNHMYDKRGELAPNYGKKHSEESKEKIRQKAFNFPKQFGSDNHMFGKKHTEEAKKKIGNANRGKPSPTKGKIKSDKEKLNDKLSQKTRKEILVFDMNDNFIGKYISIRELSRVLNIDRKAVSNCINGKNGRVSSKGFKFKLDE